MRLGAFRIVDRWRLRQHPHGYSPIQRSSQMPRVACNRAFRAFPITCISSGECMLAAIQREGLVEKEATREFAKKGENTFPKAAGPLIRCQNSIPNALPRTSFQKILESKNVVSKNSRKIANPRIKPPGSDICL
jgi:hypothetical protein